MRRGAAAIDGEKGAVGKAHLLDYKIAQNRPYEQSSHALQTAVEAEAGSAHFERMGKCKKLPA